MSDTAAEEISTELSTLTARLPEPVELGKALQRGVNAEMAAARNYGDTPLREDVYPAVRRAQELTEQLTAYGRAFAGAATLAKGYGEELLMDAAGESDGIPAENLTVPAADGDIKLTRQMVNQRSFDDEQLLAVVAASVVGSTRGTEPAQGDGQSDEDYLVEYEGWMANVIMQAMRELTSLGKFEPQVTKVKSYGAELSRSGEDKLAAALSSAVSSRQTYTGTKMERT